MNYRQLFFKHIAQTSDAPIGLEIAKASGIYLYDNLGKAYIDGISGFSVANIGHGNQQVIDAVVQQSQAYMHTIVYGEFIQQPQVAYAHLLTQNLPQNLNCVYFTNSGTEATEGALKLAKRITNRSKIISFNKAYHGSTQGALSVMGGEYFKQSFRPLLPNTFQYNFGSDDAINAIDSETCCVIVEPIQAEAGVVKASKEWFKKLREKCDKHCVLLIFDEIQSGFGRSGYLWAFEQLNIVPDILLLGKALGGGMPLGAFIADVKLMNTLTNNPVLGHITTFGGHPVSCAAGKAGFEFLLKENLVNGVLNKAEILVNAIKHHPKVLNINYAGLWMAIEFESEAITMAIAKTCVANGLVTDWFLFATNCIRLAPPLIITEQELQTLASIFLKSIDEVYFKL